MVARSFIAPVANLELQCFLSRMTVKVLNAVGLKLECLNNNLNWCLLKTRDEAEAFPTGVSLHKALEHRMVVGISEVEGARRTYLEVDLPMVDSLAVLVDHTNVVALHSLGSGYHSNRREEVEACHHTRRFEHMHLLDDQQHTSFAVEPPLELGVHMVQES